LALALVLLGLCFSQAGRLQAQSGGDQVVDSLEAYQRRIEGVLSERLNALLPRGNFVLRAMVIGHKGGAPRGQAAGTVGGLPGFQASQGQGAPVDDKFTVEQVVVRVVVNGDLRQEDAQYLRSIVPILADFRAERGDRLDLQILPSTSKEAPAAEKGGEETGRAEAPSSSAFPPLDAKGFGLTQWVLVGLAVLAVFILLIVLLAFLLRPRPRAEPAPVAAPAPSTSAARAAAKQTEAERKALEAERKQQEVGRYYESLRNGVVKTLFARPDLGKELMQAWQASSDKLTVLIHALGPSLARQALLPQMGVGTYKDFEASVRDEDPPEREKQIAVLREANLYLISRELERPEQIRPDPFAFLQDLSRGQIAHLVKSEPVKVKAIVLSRIKAEDTATILETFPKDEQLEVAVHIGNLQSLALDMVEGVALNLAEKARTVPDARTVDIEGPKALVDMMGRTTPGTSRYLLQAMKSKDRRLAEAVEKRFFVFDAIPMVPDDVLPQVVRSVPSAVVIQALQGAPQELQRKVIMAFPEQARTGVVNSVKAAKFDAATVEEARRTVVARFQVLAEQGRINLKQIGDAWQAGAKAS
jgi:flagellar motor switch protein FliG